MKIGLFRGVLALASAAIIGSAVAGAAERFVPDGHTYAPDSERLPILNSYQDQVNSQADVYQSEIYRIQRERALHETELRRHIQHDMSGSSLLGPNY